jgi:hypothetical protein
MSTAYHADPIRDWREVMHAVEKFVADAGWCCATCRQVWSLSAIPPGHPLPQVGQEL